MKLRPLKLRDANLHVARFHRHNKPVTGHRFSIGLFDEARLIGVAIVGRPISRHLDDGGTAEVLRLCVVDDSPKGSCSMLYAACWRAWAAMGGARIITYTLTSESGASLRGAGWAPHTIESTKEGNIGWNSRDGRERQMVMFEPKVRWEKAAKGEK